MNNRHRWTDNEIINVGKQYAHKGDWKRSKVSNHSAAYQAALNRPEVFLQATEHMKPKANPYSGSYIVYAYEFTDRHVYVGLTFLPKSRHYQHMQRGPVFDHIQVCAGYAYRILEQDIASPGAVVTHERKWVDHYTAQGWTLLNSNTAGGLGTIEAVKWTKEAVFAEARKHQNKQAWIDSSRRSYDIAKREGWFDEASAHMPARVLGVGVGIKRSQATRDKLSTAAQERAADPAWRSAHSKRLKGRKLTTEQREAIKTGMRNAGFGQNT